MNGWWSGRGGEEHKKDDDYVPEDIEIVIQHDKSEEELKKDFVYRFYDRLRELYGQEVMRAHFFSDMTYFEGGYYWMISTHEVARVLRNNDVRYLARVKLVGGTDSLELYVAKDVAECVDSLIELCESYKLNVTIKKDKIN
jgi:hypothetical protein